MVCVPRATASASTSAPPIVVPNVEATVILPAPLVTIIPLPCVIVASAYPTPLPISSCPLAADAPLRPVPPYCALIIPPCHVPEVIVPTTLISLRLPLVMSVPLTSGRAYVLVVEVVMFAS